MWKYLAVLLFLAVATIFVARQDERAAQQRNHESAHTNHSLFTCVANPEQSQSNAKDAERDCSSWFGFFRWPNGTTTWAILLTLWALVEQTRETKRATDSQREKDRARLIFTGFRNNESLGDEDVREAYWSFSILLKQYGPTKAFNVRGLGTVTVKPADEPRPTRSRKKMTRLHDIPSIAGEAAGNNSVLIEPTIGFAAINDADMAKVNSGELCVHFFGFIEYDDVFGSKHTTRFRYIWQPELREPVPQEEGETFVAVEAGWKINGKPKDNHAD